MLNPHPFAGRIGSGCTALQFYDFRFYSEGYLGKTNVPNISTIRSIQYSSTSMKVFKASNVGDGVTVPYKKIDFETNMPLTSPFTNPINDQASILVSKKYERFFHYIYIFLDLGEAIVSITSF